MFVLVAINTKSINDYTFVHFDDAGEDFLAGLEQFNYEPRGFLGSPWGPWALGLLVSPGAQEPRSSKTMNSNFAPYQGRVNWA